MEDPITHQIAIGMVTSWLLERLKNSRWFPWISQRTDKINRIISISVAFLSSVGIKAAMQGNLTFSSGATITLAVPSLSIILDTFIHAISQFGVQQATYKGLIQGSRLPDATESIIIRTP